MDACCFASPLIGAALGAGGSLGDLGSLAGGPFILRKEWKSHVAGFLAS